jgi:hypothetical protein
MHDTCDKADNWHELRVMFCLIDVYTLYSV